jgi:hypothetical protein
MDPATPASNPNIADSRGLVVRPVLPLDHRLELTWFERTSELPEGLWQACFSTPNEGLFWFRSLERAEITDQFRFLFGLLRLDGVPAGIVPAFLFDLPLDLVFPPRIARLVMHLARGPLRRIAFQRTLFIGNVAGEEGHVGLGQGHSLNQFADFIHREARVRAKALGAAMLVWKDFPAADRPALDALMKAGRVFRTPSYPGTTIPIVRGGYRAFLSTLRSDRRWKINDKLRRGARKIAVVTTVTSRPDETEISEIFALFWQTYLRGETKFERLTRAFFGAIAACDESTFVIQRDAGTGKMIAFMLLFDLGERVVNQFIGIDYAAAEGGFLYFRLFAEAYEWACSTEATVMQSGQTGYMAKLDLGHKLVPLWNFCEHLNGFMNVIYRHVGSRITWQTLDEQLRAYLDAHPEAIET